MARAARIDRRTAYVGRVDTQVGPLLVAVADGKLCAIKLARDAARLGEAREEMQRELGRAFALVDDDARVAPMAERVQALVTGEREDVGAELDLSWLTQFQRDVLLATARIPRGKVASYRDIAAQVGRPNAYRAVGNTMRNNPIPLVIPCHRVVGSDGSLTGFGGGLGMKRQLLEMEGALQAVSRRR